MSQSTDTLKTKSSFTHAGQSYDYYSLEKAGASLPGVAKLPFSLKVVLENLLRHENNGKTVSVDDIQAFEGWLEKGKSTTEISYYPARVLMQDFTGVPAVVDLAAMRDSLEKQGGDPQMVNPLTPVDLVIDHSVMVDYFGTPDAFEQNTALEFERNQERYEFLKWGQKAFSNFRVVPPGTGICHQVNLEYLAQVAFKQENAGENPMLYPDTCVGTDSHTTMINGLGVLGWGVGGIEAEAVMLGQPVSMLIPEVVGFKLTGSLKEGVTATDLVLTIVEQLRELGVVGKFVEFFGSGLAELSLPNRATIANMAPEYGATCGIFPIDAETIKYINFTGRDGALVEAYARENMFWVDETTPDATYTTTLELDLGDVVPSLAGPKRPQDRLGLGEVKTSYQSLISAASKDQSYGVEKHDFELTNGDVVIAAITSCTNTSNPDVLIGAGLLAKKALEKGLTTKPWVKTSLAPGSQVVAEYLNESGLQDSLDELGFHIAGFGCTTCIGNSGPLQDDIVNTIESNDLTVSAVLSGNRNFEGRISPQVKANYLASPPLVVAYALAGSTGIDLTREPLGQDKDGKDVYLADIWPSNAEITEVVNSSVRSEMFSDRYADVFEGPEMWRELPIKEGALYSWDDTSTYVRLPSFFEGSQGVNKQTVTLQGARPLGIFGDSVTTDHISPAGVIKEDSPAGSYLKSQSVERKDFNSYGARRGNHEVMMRGTFANIRIKNKMVPGTEGGVTKFYPDGETMTIYDAAIKYKETQTPLVVFGGKEYGTGSSRDWAAKGTNLLGVKAVIAESFERIHRANLVFMGVLPLQMAEGETLEALKLVGDETFDLKAVSDVASAKQEYHLTVKRADGTETKVKLFSRIDTENEIDYFAHGGILQYVLSGAEDKDSQAAAS